MVREFLAMALPVSIGDAILLAKIAFNLGQAFTSGRKSAPAEFADIQNLLYTLSNALELVAKETQQLVQAETEGKGNHNVVVAQIIANCRVTLEHLQSLVAQYMELDVSGNQKDQSRQRKWKDEAKRNWKKVVWTKEGGGLDRLKATLAVHINGLNLAVTALNK